MNDCFLFFNFFIRVFKGYTLGLYTVCIEMHDRECNRLYDADIFELSIDQKRDFNIDGRSVPYPFPIPYPFANYRHSLERRTPLMYAKQYYKNPAPPYVKAQMREWSIFKLLPAFYDGSSNEIWLKPSWWTHKINTNSLVFNYFDNWWTKIQVVDQHRINVSVLNNAYPHIFIKITRNDAFQMVDSVNGSMLILVNVNFDQPLQPSTEYYK